MIEVEYTLDHPILRETLQSGVSVTLNWESSQTGPNDERRMIAWLESDDFDAVERAIRDDPSVENPVVLTDLGDRRLYRFDLAEVGKESSIMPILADVGGVHQELTADAEGWRNRTRFPDRESFERLRRFCSDNDIPFRFERLWQQSDRDGGRPSAVTEAQHETLLAAVESGYLDVPRKCSLAELGAELGISQSAASERFRRGTKRLVESTLGSEGDEA
ncbi:helix-turn-helix domain-containing protein [Haloarculaceae archaeon H-GB2-1]|nr:helix-turn-helix domain-containing protein [Haloarculaceae archaeon H-GB1-1]MEA5386186.1 helix-turn-helix domain-containing protein [Haloarculaceae archaeon H-GB11]MEA5407692.1 helix-turn-helix domain-containing protein [Haloarculaceae archaeon H-GB2-1]